MKYLTILAALIFLLEPAHSQTIKASDHARAGLESSTSTNVDHSTGILNYHIPLIKRNDGGPTVSIGLSYAAKGIKVDQNPSVVGLGWNLVGEGVVSRTIRGLSDESGWGILNYPIPSDPNALATFKDQVNQGLRDGETDIFTLNYSQAGLNEKFFLERFTSPSNLSLQYKAVSLTKSDVKITVINDPGRPWSLVGFEVLNINGEKLKFILMEGLGASVFGSFGYPISSSSGYTNAWYLTEATDQNGEKIKFEYYSDYISDNQHVREEQVMCYGQDWLTYGTNGLVSGQIESYMNSVQSNSVIRGNIHSRMRWLQDNIDYQFDQMSKADYSSFFNTVGDYLNGSANAGVLSGISQQFWGGYLVDKYQTEMQSLVTQLPNYNSPQSDTYLESLMMLLNTAADYKKSTKFSSYSARINQVKLLKRIQLKNSLIEFKYNTTMRDWKPMTFLDRIDIRTGDSTIINTIVFEYSPSQYGTGSPYLKALRMKGADVQDGEDKYSFDYFNEDVQNHGLERDFWGYCLGSNNSSSLLPYEMTVGDFLSPYARQIFQHPDHEVIIVDTAGIDFVSRAPVAQYTLYRTLKNVHLPNGGKYEFEYENNTVPDENNHAVSVLTGGIRIKKIKTFDGLGAEYVKSFKYEYANPGSNQLKSSGYHVKRYMQTMTLNILYPNIEQDVMLLSNPFYLGPQLEDSGNEDVFYTYVEEHNEGLGKTGYRYLNLTAGYDTYPYWLEGLLLARAEYDEAGNLKSIERFKYQGAQDDKISFSFDYNKLATSSSYQFSLNKNQLKSLPFKPYAYTIDMYSYVSNNMTSYQYDYENLYDFNMKTRLAITNPTISYSFRYGGAVVLKETERWTSSQGTVTGGAAPPSSPYANIYDDGWLFATNYGDGHWEKQVYHYDNPAHVYPTRIEAIGSNGEKSCVKTKYVADYTSTAASFISSLYDANRKADVIETQKWAYDQGASAWKLIGGELNTYDIVMPSSQNLSGQQSILPVATYITELDQPLSPGAGGWNEQFTSTGPYNTIFHESQALYKPNATMGWNALPWGISFSGKSTNNGLKNQAVSSDGFNEVQVQGAKPNEVLMLSYLGSPIKQKVTMDNINLNNISDVLSFKYDYVGYARDMLSRIRILPTYYFGVPSHYYPVLRTLDSVLLTIDQHLDYNIFDRLRISLETELALVPSYDDPSLDQFFLPHISMLEIRILSYELNSYLLQDSSLYDLILELQYCATTATGNFECYLDLESYKQSGKRLQFTARSGFALNYVVHYNGSSPQTYTINGYRNAYLDPATIPNAANAIGLSFFIDNDSRAYDVFVLPEGLPFEFTSRNKFGNMNYRFNDKGEFTYYDYDSRQRLRYVRDKNSKYVKSYRYNDAQN